MKNPLKQSRIRRSAAAILLAAAVAANGSSGTTAGAEAVEITGDVEPIDLAVLVGFTGVRFTQDIISGAEWAAEDLGPIDLTIGGFTTPDDIIGAQQQVVNMLEQQPDGIAVSPFPPELWQATLEDTTARLDNTLVLTGKPVAEVDQVDESPVRTFVGANDTEVGRAAMRALVEAAGLGPDTTGVALLGQCLPGDSGTLYDRTVGFTEVIAELLPNVEARVFDSKPLQQDNTNAWEAALLQTPDPVLAIGTCGQDGVSLYNLKQRLGGDFPIGAVDSPETLGGYADGTIQAAVVVNWWLEGYAAVRLLADTARGGEPSEGFFDAGFVVVSDENVDGLIARDASAEASAEWYATQIDEIWSDIDAFMQPMAEAWR